MTPEETSAASLACPFSSEGSPSRVHRRVPTIRKECPLPASAEVEIRQGRRAQHRGQHEGGAGVDSPEAATQRQAAAMRTSGPQTLVHEHSQVVTRQQGS